MSLEDWERWVRISKLKEENKCVYRINWVLKNEFYCNQCSFNDTRDVCISRLITVLNNKDFEKLDKNLLP